MKKYSNEEIRGTLSVRGRVHGSLNVHDKVKAAGFYLSAGSQGAGHDLGRGVIPLDIAAPDVTNYYLDSFVDQPYVVEDVKLATVTGTCQVGFYTLISTQPTPHGVGIGGTAKDNNLGDFYVAPKLRQIVASSNNKINKDESLVMSVFQNSSATHLRGRIRIRFSG